MWPNLTKYLRERRVSVSGYFENFATGNRLCSRKNRLPGDPNFEKDETNDADFTNS